MALLSLEEKGREGEKKPRMGGRRWRVSFVTLLALSCSFRNPLLAQTDDMPLGENSCFAISSSFFSLCDLSLSMCLSGSVCMSFCMYLRDREQERQKPWVCGVRHKASREKMRKTTTETHVPLQHP